MSEESRLLEAIEDADDHVARMTRIRRTCVAICVPSLLAAIAGMWFLSYLHSIGADWGDASGFANFFLLIVACISGGTGFSAAQELDSARQRAKIARRKHTHYLMKD
jgi:hypothetical protein